jgi:hypothetical protein
VGEQLLMRLTGDATPPPGSGPLRLATPAASIPKAPPTAAGRHEADEPITVPTTAAASAKTPTSFF